MRKVLISIAALAVVLAAAALQAKEIVLTPARVATIVSPEDARDARVLLCFDLPQELLEGKVKVENAALLFGGAIEDADFGLVHIFPATTAWRAAASVSWNSPWETAGGDFTKAIAGKSVTLKGADGAKEISSNVTFIVMDWVSGRLANNGLILVPSQEDLVNSAGKFGFDTGSLKLRIECSAWLGPQ